jgi:hypothetical protein
VTLSVTPTLLDTSEAWIENIPTFPMNSPSHTKLVLGPQTFCPVNIANAAAEPLAEIAQPDPANIGKLALAVRSKVILSQSTVKAVNCDPSGALAS